MVNLLSYINRNSAFKGFVTGLLLWVASAFTPAHADSQTYFHSVSAPSTDISAFHKWTRVISDSRREGTGLLQYSGWRELLSGSHQLTAFDTLDAINDRVNRYEYIEDTSGWNRSDYWATPLQFFTKGGGDCEDYAIVKYMALRTLGWKAEDMRIVILQDTKLNELHAVLAVMLEGETYILDNQIEGLATLEDIPHYRPIYSINEQAWWRYLPAEKAA